MSTNAEGTRIHLPGLSKAERRLVALVTAGRTNREIAAELNLVEQTIKNRLSVVYRKCGVRNRTELVLLAFQAGLVPRDRPMRASD